MLKVDVTRGGYIESTHLIHARVESADGNVLYNTTEDFDFFPRSAIKPLQTYLLIKSGAFSAYDLDLRHLALASASHGGEILHTEIISNWLKKINLDQTALRCGAHWPSDSDSTIYLQQNRLQPTSLHNNCSGKHTGFLTVCQHLKLPTEGYHLAHHPLQEKLKAILENELETELKNYGIDGCSIPAYKLSFNKMNRALAKMSAEAMQDSNSTAGLVLRAFLEHPVLTSSHDQYYVHAMLKNAGQVLVKGGAEGVVSGFVPKNKISILVKCQDGTHRGALYAFDYLMQKYAGLDSAISSTLVNWVGTEVGEVKITDT